MHRCLRITEIFHLIIGYLVDEEVTSANVTSAIRHKDVASLARTCKAFMDPALDALWSTQSSLSPLVMCLPAHFWFLKAVWRGTVVSLLHEPSHEDWLMLKRYSRRIRAFDRTTLRLPTVSQNIVDTVFSPDLSDELFPRLHTLNVNIFSKPPPDPIQLLGHIRLPQLVQLRFKIPRFHRHRDTDLYLTPACVPSLQALKICAARSRLDASARLAVNFRGIPYLRSLYLSRHLPVLPSSLRELSHLQYLCELTVTLPDDFDVDVCPSMQPTFPSLQCIAVTVGSLSQCTNLLSSIASCELGSVKIFYCSPPTQNDIYELFQEIVHIRQRYADFSTLDIQCSHPTPPIPHLPFNFPRSMLTPFLTCHRLRVLELTSLGTLDIDDSFIAQITPAWPVIEVLHLRASQQNDGCVTLEGIRGLLRGCTRLQSLHMQVDARILPEGEPEMQSLSLARLDISGSHMEDETAVERYLKTLAPRLEWLKMKPPSLDVST
ncbi:hypothetical protein EDD16DRAFT_419415 [Pisolithus croceorrhizus]|nr:hypothetical protein EV401DRAFT_1883734 [Pisolithus croceorrhizus]KAI6132592.1 hypothetical protein EDD16DRAFT_419415 [Pisolithus croceorrhizus]KAI6141348.1 hypothetical protein EDD17DRAFT_1769790 [Pisolithus thermaeus]